MIPIPDDKFGVSLILKNKTWQDVYRIFVIFLLGVGFFVPVFAEQPRLATFHEIASVIVDQRLSNNVTASVSLQTTSIQEFQVPPQLDAKIRNNTEIIAVVITNENQCVLGVQDEICVMINIKRTPSEGGIVAHQEKAKQIGDSLIDDINSVFGLQTKFHSVFIHYDDKTNKALDTSGEVSGAGTISAVYTAQMQSTDFMFNKISGVLIPRQIRDMGGFYDIALQLAKDDTSTMTFTILPKGETSVMQLKVADDYPHLAKDINKIEPLQFLRVDQIKKSDYFSVGFFPLNSIVHVVVLTEDNSTKIHAANIIESTVKDGQKIPSDITKSGWFFNSESGSKIEAMYLFGEGFSASSQDMSLTLETNQVVQTKFDETYILIGIGAAAAGAAVFYLKGIRRKG